MTLDHSSPDVPPIPDPFPEPAAPRPKVEGCGTPALLGCVVVLAVFGVVGGVFLFKARDLVSWAFDESRGAILEALPEDVSQEQRDRLDRAFVAVTEAVLEDRVSASDLGQVQRALAEAQKEVRRGTLDSEGVDRLITSLEGVSGKRDPEGLAPAPGDSGGGEEVDDGDRGEPK